MTRQQLQNFFTEDAENELKRMSNQALASELTSYGVGMHWEEKLCNRNIEDKAQRGNSAVNKEHECLKWLNSKEPESVLFICFGSVYHFKAAQLTELALSIEASGHNFFWVVEKEENTNEDDQWLPEGFEDRMKEKGLIIRDWAPQMLILDHEAVGGFMTLCG